MIYLLLNKLAFRPHWSSVYPRHSISTESVVQKNLFQTCCASHRRQSLFAESRRRSIISSSVLKSDVSERNSSRFSVPVIRKMLQPILDSRTRTALTGTLHACSVYQLLCSCSSSVLFHTNSTCECVIINYNYITAHKSSFIPISLNHGPTSLTKPFGL